MPEVALFFLISKYILREKMRKIILQSLPSTYV